MVLFYTQLCIYIFYIYCCIQNILSVHTLKSRWHDIIIIIIIIIAIIIIIIILLLASFSHQYSLESEK